MFDELQEEMGLTYLFIAHDLLVVRHISDRIAVMYLGKMVEMADASEIYAGPLGQFKKDWSVLRLEQRFAQEDSAAA